MAKELTPSEIVSALQAMGLPIPEELNNRAANETNDAIERKIASKLHGDDSDPKTIQSAETWREDLFALANEFVLAFNGEEKNVGQGRVFERMITIELPDGSAFTIRHREPREKK